MTAENPGISVERDQETVPGRDGISVYRYIGIF